MAEADAIALSFHNDGGRLLLSELDENDFPGIEEAVKAYIEVVRETLARLTGHRDFRQIRLQETDEYLQHDDVQSSFAVAIGKAKLGPDGELVDVTDESSPLDLLALLTAKSGIPGTLGSKVAGDEEGALIVTDAALKKRVDGLLKDLKPVELMQASLTEEQEQVLVDALMSLAPMLEDGQDEDSLLEPVHPGDLLTLLLAYAAERVAKPAAAGGGKNPIVQGLGWVRGQVAGSIRRVRSIRKVVWRLEDVAVGGARLAGRVVRRSLQPLVVGLVLNRALATLERSRDPTIRLAKLPPADEVDQHFTRLMGKDWQAQMEADFLEAVRDVQDGYVTDDYRDEKRKMAAAMLRRLEIEDWDKERMRHFYYGSYGLGPWYFDMEERLHNPFFIGARAWNGPIEGWLGRNKKYADAVPQPNTELTSAALDVVEKKRGIKLSAKQRSSLTSRQGLTTTDFLLGSDLLSRSIGKAKLKEVLA